MNMIDIRRRQMADALTPMLLTDARYQTSDATQALAFLVSQLTHVESTIYARQRQGIQYRDLVPISTEAGEYATSVTYQMYDYSGRGKRHSGRGEDIPTVDVAYAQRACLSCWAPLATITPPRNCANRPFCVNPEYRAGGCGDGCL